MKDGATLHRLGEIAPVEDWYFAVATTGEVTDLCIRCKRGERLSRLMVAGVCPAGYIRMGDVAAQAA